MTSPDAGTAFSDLACAHRVRVLGGLASGAPTLVRFALSPADRDHARAWSACTTADTASTNTNTADLRPADMAVTLSRDTLASIDDPLATAMRAALAGYDRPRTPVRLMGIVNVTPDSFSDGGLHATTESAVAHARRLVDEGADLLDIGGESTRPGARPVDVVSELERVVPVIEALADAPVPIAVDTRKAEVAARAVDAGATWVNDVSGGTHDPAMLRTVADRAVTYVAMHTQGDPQDMQADPRYGDPVHEVHEALRDRGRACLDAGIAPECLVLDPGIGFGKRLEHNLALLRRLPELRSLGCDLLLGVSRKSFIGHLTGAEEQGGWRSAERRDHPADRIGGSVAAGLACVRGGADVLRVHDVRIMHEALQVANALADPAPPTN